MIYYAAENAYGSESSSGFSNTWYVLAFRTRKHRDNWVDGRNTLSARTIKKCEVKDYVDNPRPFSGEFRGIFRPECDSCGNIPDGLIGRVEKTSGLDDYGLIRRLG